MRLLGGRRREGERVVLPDWSLLVDRVTGLPLDLTLRGDLPVEGDLELAGVGLSEEPDGEGESPSEDGGVVVPLFGGARLSGAVELEDEDDEDDPEDDDPDDAPPSGPSPGEILRAGRRRR